MRSCGRSPPWAPPTRRGTSGAPCRDHAEPFHVVRAAALAFRRAAPRVDRAPGSRYRPRARRGAARRGLRSRDLRRPRQNLALPAPQAGALRGRRGRRRRRDGARLRARGGARVARRPPAALSEHTAGRGRDRRRVTGAGGRPVRLHRRPRGRRAGPRRRRGAGRDEGRSGMSGQPIVEARAIRKTYDTGKVQVNALNGVDLALERGKMVAIMGPSGCGKTTLLNCLSGLDAIDEGEVLIEGVPLSEMSDRQRTDYRARRMGFVFQFYNLMPVLTAVENVELPLLVARFSASEARRRALDALGLVGLAERAGHVPDELSGGERQRVTIARSLVNDPAIVWADEPTGDLDSENAEEIVELMRRLNLERGLTFLIVTHDIAVGKATDRITRMLDGHVVEQHRMECRMYSRVTLLEIDTLRTSMDEALGLFTEHVLPGLREHEGYEGVLVLTTPEGRGMIVSFWETESDANAA